MTQEEMKQAWAETDARLSKIEKRLAIVDDTYHTRLGERRTALDNLARRYRRFSLVALAMTGVTVMYAIGDILPGLEARWLWLCFALFFAIASVMDSWLYRGVSSINVTTMSVSEVTRLSLRYRRWHLIFIAILLPMALALIITMLWVAGFERYFTLGVAGGFIIGLAIGLRKFFDFMADYKVMSNGNC